MRFQQYLPFLAPVGFLFLFSCTAPLAREAALPVNPAHSASTRNETPLPRPYLRLIEQAHRDADKGVAALEAQAIDEANAWFAQALMPLLEQAGQTQRNLQPHIDNLIDTIHRAERNHLALVNRKASSPESPESPGKAAQPGIDDENDPLAPSPTLALLLDPKLIESEIAQLHPTPPLIIHDAAYDYPVVQNNIVDRFANYLSTDKAHQIGEGLENATRYVPMMRSILAEKGVPRDLCYLPVIESSYRVRIRSHAAAVGIWQFIASTAKLYGLRVNWWIDERLHPIRATEAAGEFLKDLHRDFNDWNLVLCAYNAGPGRVRSAIRRGNTRDFWEMFDRKLLPSETTAYVPAFMASLRIVKNPTAYGFANLDYQSSPDVATIDTRAGFDLESLAKAIDTPVTELVELNPFLIRYFAPGGESVTLFVPSDKLEATRSFLAKAPAKLRGGNGRYKVQRGDNLGKVAKKFGVRSKEILALNNLSSSKIKAGMEILIPSSNLNASPTLFVPSGGPERLPLETFRYQPMRGDTLYLIAKRFQTTIPSILERNPDLDPLRIEEGLSLTIRQGDVWRVQPKSPAYTPNSQPYQVVKGDTLQKIATHFQLPLHRILSANQMTIMTPIRAGQTLQIPLQNETPKRVDVHRVARGETLLAIANKYGVSVEDLLEWNQIGKRKSIKSGQRLVIYR